MSGSRPIHRSSSASTPAKRSLKSSIIDLLINHPWTPPSCLPVSSAGDGNSNVKRPGRPPYKWTAHRTRALIRLVIKTDIAFDDIPAALKDPHTGEGPGDATCRKYWESIFGCPPDDARLKSKEGRSRRHKHHRQAYNAWRRLENARQKCEDILQSSSETHISSAWPDVVPEGHHSSLDHGRGWIAASSSETRDFANAGEAPESSSAPRDDCSPGSSVSDVSLAAAHQRAPAGPPQTPADVERKYGLDKGQLDWYKHASYSSFLSRISSRLSLALSPQNSRVNSRVNSMTVSPRSTMDHPATTDPAAAARAPTDIRSPICFLLERCRFEDVPFQDLHHRVLELIDEHGADVNERNEDGQTPLHLAVELGCLQVMCVLLQRGADPAAVEDDARSVSAYGRMFERAPTCSDGVRAHIARAREVVKYNPRLENTASTVPHHRRRRSSSSAAAMPPPLPAPPQPTHPSSFPMVAPARTTSAPRFSHPSPARGAQKGKHSSLRSATTAEPRLQTLSEQTATSLMEMEAEGEHGENEPQGRLRSSRSLSELFERWRERE